MPKFELNLLADTCLMLKTQAVFRRVALWSAVAVWTMQTVGCLETESEAEEWRRLEKQLQKAATTDEFVQNAGAYYRFYESRPNSPLASEALFKSAQQLLSAQKPQHALQRFEQLRTRYPKSKEAEAALFMTGYIYNNYISDKDNARAAFEAFIAQYPANELAASAQFELQYLGVAAGDIFPEKPAQKSAAETANADSSVKKSKRKSSRAPSAQ